jgi:hypothetical protein
MRIDLDRFSQSCNPSHTLAIANPEDRQYYIDFATVRGANVIQELARTITKLSPNQRTCQLFTGHIGCGKSTELRRLEAELQAQGFHVVYFESTEDLDMGDVDVSDIMLAIIRQVTESLEAVGIRLRPRYFERLFREIGDFLQTPVELSYEKKFSLPYGLGEITAKTKDSPNLRSQLRQYLEPRTQPILEAINQEILAPAKLELQDLGKKGLVVIIDNLDRIDPIAKLGGRSQSEYIFIDRGEQLRKLDCHLVYTIPLALVFSNEGETLKNRLGGGVYPKVLPMVPVQNPDGSEHSKGMELLRQMLLARAFPELIPVQRLQLLTQVFDTPETLSRICQVSGGHTRNILGLLYSCLQIQDPPITAEILDNVVNQAHNALVSAIKDDEWELLQQIVEKQSLSPEESYLLRSLFLFEYRDAQRRWFGINPLLAESKLC